MYDKIVSPTPAPHNGHSPRDSWVSYSFERSWSRILSTISWTLSLISDMYASLWFVPLCTPSSFDSMSPVNSAEVIQLTGILLSMSIILMPCGVARSEPPLPRPMNSLEINFSIVSARVAGVPNPLPFIAAANSSSSIFLPACSINRKRPASFSRPGGFVFSSLNS